MNLHIPVQATDSTRIAGYIVPGGNGTYDATIIIRTYTASGEPDGVREKQLGTFRSRQTAEFEVRYQEWVARGCPILDEAAADAASGHTW